MERQNPTSEKHSGVRPFFPLTFVLTWMFWIPIAGPCSSGPL